MNTTIHQLHQVNDHFAKFVPESARRLLAAGAEVPELSMREDDVSVLFLDISGYSHLSQQMSPRVTQCISRTVFSVFLDCIHAADGDINEIAGDGLWPSFRTCLPVSM